MSKIIRWVLTIALTYGAYTETGIFTALSLLLIFVAIEAQGWLTKRALDEGRAVQNFIESTRRPSQVTQSVSPTGEK